MTRFPSELAPPSELERLAEIHRKCAANAHVARAQKRPARRRKQTRRPKR
jgi:hypothetical protein